MFFVLFFWLVCLFVFCFCFLGLHWWHNKFPGKGSNQSYSCCQPTPQPQQWGIQTAFTTYTTAHGNARTPTPWVRTGIKPTSSWILVRFVSTAPQRGLLKDIVLVSNLTQNYLSLRHEAISMLPMERIPQMLKFLKKHTAVPICQDFRVSRQTE